ncbi:MAG: hypothetical protein JWQ17_1888, partial [Tardiphaga sp.]|nr:hypothetical protein [Tardiphaga sp.]
MVARDGLSLVSIMPHFGTHNVPGDLANSSGWALRGVEPGGLMSYAIARADRVAASGRMTLTAAAWVLACGASVLACGVAAWVAGFDPIAFALNAAAPKHVHEASFEARFTSASALNVLPPDLSSGRLVQSLVPEHAEREAKLQEARGELAQKLQSEDWRTTLFGEPAPPPAPAPAPTPTVTPAVPLPMSRPVTANFEVPVSAPPVQADKDNRSLLRKLADALPVPLTLASLAPDGGLMRDGPDLAALGYDNATAVYDISARAVFMPNGTKLEAHSGFGGLKDDPGHVDERNVGATPPNVYELKPRERLFHGVQALRMVAVGGNGTLGRSGLLAHSYMLGPNGDSKGCVSIKDYQKFLNAFQNGEIKRLVV